MSLTGKQKRNLGHLLFWLLVVCMIGAGAFGIASIATGSQPAAATPKAPPVPQVNAQHYEQINTANDNTVDHYCVGSDGMWFGYYSGQFAVMKDDPLCR